MSEESERKAEIPWVVVVLIAVVISLIAYAIWAITDKILNEGANIRFASEHDGAGGFGDKYGLPDALRVSTSSRPGQVRVMRVPVAGGIIQPAILV